MVFRLALMRHADAEWPLPGEKDIDRKLSIFGEKEARSAGEFLRNVGFTPSVVVSSTARRCLDTFSIVNNTLDDLLLAQRSGQLYNSSVDDYIQVLSQYIDHASLLLIGHNPTLEELVAKLLKDKQAVDHMPEGFKTGSIAIIDVANLSEFGSASGQMIAYFEPSVEG